MKVICNINNVNEISDESTLSRLNKYIFMPDGDLDLLVGKEYTVYGVVFWDNSPWYYICTEEYDDYPKTFAAEFFHISDDKISSCWKLSVVNKGNNNIISSLLFNEWEKILIFMRI